MELLPSLPAEKILASLDVSDLLSCSLVCVSWRSLVNSDHVWKQKCYNECDKFTIEYLQSVSSQVSPTFEEPETSEMLEPLCYWRTVFMKLQHLKHNWRWGNHNVSNVIGFAYNHYDLKIDKDTLVAIVDEHSCEVWNIRHIPFRQDSIICALKNASCKCMIHLCNEKIVIVQDTLLQVYHKCGRMFKLFFRRLFNQTEADSESIPRSVILDEWYSATLKLRPTHLQAFNVGKYFIGLAENGNLENAFFHVWDILTGSKLKKQSVKDLCADNNGTIINIKFCTSKSEFEKILVCVQHSQHPKSLTNRSYYTVVVVYDLARLVAIKRIALKPHVPWIFFEYHYVVTMGQDRDKLTILDCSSGASLHSAQYENQINPDSVQVNKDYIGFSTGGRLLVYKLSNFQPVFSTLINRFSSNLFGFDFLFLNWNLILISTYDKTNKIEVWSIKEQCRLSTLKCNGLMYPCNNSAKFFVWNEMITTIHMLQFW